MKERLNKASYVITLLKTSRRELLDKISSVKKKFRVTHEEIYERGLESFMKEKKINA